MRRSAIAASLVALVLMAGLAQAGTMPIGERGLDEPVLDGQKLEEAGPFPMMRPEDEAFEIADDEAAELPEQIERYAAPDEDETHGMLGRGDIRRSLRDQGFSEIDNLRRRGRVFVAEVTGPHGDRMRVVINGATGDISGLKVLDRMDGGRRAELDFLEQ